MAHIISIISSKGTYKDEKNGIERPYDNLIFHLSSGANYYSNEQLIAGEGKPTQVKIKTEDFTKLCQIPVKDLFGKEIKFITENGQLSKIEIK